ncbi:MAG: FAD-dependent oxidoreductase [Erysipelotrichaceae bacterium]|nr:FAD-dependent oxidoreductase [Erysipelotrichaceae bacterium]
MKNAIVIGSGAGGAMMAKELQGHYQVTILEAGNAFQPFSFSVNNLGKLRKTGLFLDERMISLLFPAMRVQKASSNMIMVHGECTGGTTTLATGSALRCDDDLINIGIHLDEEFEELSQEIPLSIDHQQYWSTLIKDLFEACEQLGFAPMPTTKLVDYKRCVRCGHCVLGCQTGAKWDSRQLLSESINKGAILKTNCKVTKLGIDYNTNTVNTVYVKEHGRRLEYQADLVVLAAGGFGTPVILENSGIECESTLFVDPVLCVAAHYPGIAANHQIPMPFLMQREGYMLSPYMDYLSYFFNKSWRLPSKDILSMMIKLSDSSFGGSHNNGIEKELTSEDQKKLKSAVSDCKKIFSKMGIKQEDIFLGTLNAGHPGGMLPLTSEESESFHNQRLPKNLYVADATILPHSMGNPPIWTIMALSKRIAKVCIETFK